MSPDFYELWHSVMSISVHRCKAAMGYISTGMGNRFSAILVPLMAHTSRLKPLSALFAIASNMK